MLGQYGIQGLNAQGLGDIAPEEFLALQHALRRQNMRKATSSAGYHLPAGQDEGSGDPLVPQSLEGTLATATFKREDAIFWRMVSKKNVFATVNEYTRIEQHGDEELSPFFTEGGVPIATVTDYAREFSRIKYLGVQGSVSFPMLRSRVIGGQPNAEAQEVNAKTLHLVGRIEYNSYFADSRIDDLEYDGVRSILEQFAAANVVDLRGGVLTGKQMRQDMALHRDLHAMPTAVLMSNAVRSDLGNMGEASIRRPVTPGQSPAGQKLGMRADGVEADHGYVPFHSTVFLQARGNANTAKIEPDSTAPAPSTPTVANPLSSPVDATAQFTADDAGTYIYKVTAHGTNGVSAPMVTDGVGGNPAVIAVSAGDRVDIELDDNAVTDVKYYSVYRSAKDGGEATCKFLGRTKKAAAGKTTIKDRNADIPGTTWTFSIQMTEDVIECIRLLDLMKQDLAIRTTTKEFLLICFMALRSRTPTKIWGWKNCGRLPT